MVPGSVVVTHTDGDMTTVPALEAVGISKHFGGTAALTGVDFSCRRGEVHVLLGANGAGKSTLVKILSGVQRADTGIVRVDGREVEMHNPLQASAAGVSAVFQKLSLCPHLTVAENIMLAHEPLGPLRQIRSKQLRRDVESLFEQLEIRHISPNALVADLALADRQLVEIAKALSHDPQILIVDEGTSALGQEEVRRLFDLLDNLRRDGKAIIFISHRMSEVREIADRMTIFRNGSKVRTGAARDISDDQVVELMLGERVQQSFPTRAELRHDAESVLQVESLTVRGVLEDINFSVRAGEVLGIAGLEGQGQGELLLALFGVIRGLAGSVSVHGRRVRLGTPWRAMRAGFALIPEDRGAQGLLQPLSIRENMVLASLGRFTRFGLINRDREREATLRGIERLEIKAASMELPVSALSGGNQQKVIIAKWLEAGGDIFLFYDPTRGVDVGTKHAFYELIQKLANAGKAVLLYTTELSEFVGLCHRVLIMNDHRIVKQLEGDGISESGILSASIGMTEPSTSTENSSEISDEQMQP